MIVKTCDYGATLSATRESAPFRRFAFTSFSAAAGFSPAMREGAVVAYVGDAQPASRSRPIRIARKEVIRDARFSAPDGIVVRFEDGLKLRIPVRDLDLPVEEFQWETVKAIEAGDAIAIHDNRGDEITVDAAALRSIADPKFAAKQTEDFLKARGSLAKNDEAFRPPREWYDEADGEDGN